MRPFLLAGLLLSAGLLRADEPKIPFDIHAGLAQRTLKEFAAQSKREIVFSAEAVAGVQTQALRGTFTAADGLARMLDGGPLVADQDASTGAFAVRRKSPGPPAAADPSPPRGLGRDVGAAAGDPAIEGKLMRPVGGNPLKGIVVTLLETGATAVVDDTGNFEFPSAAPGRYTLSAEGNGYSRLKIADVVVTAGATQSLTEEMPLNAPGGEESVSASSGNANRGVQVLPQFYVTEAPARPYEQPGGDVDLPRTSNDVQPYTIIDREAIDESNAVNLGDFLQQQLTQNTTGLQYDQEAGGPSVSTRGLSQVNLVGLGSLQTLILINGHRTSGVVDEGTEYQSDINQIPLSAVDHIEVLPSSASAIYGASAAGGVVNIVLKQDYTGGEVDASYLNTFDAYAPRETYSVAVGVPIGSDTHLSFFGNYGSGASIDMQARPFIINYYLKALQNDPALFYSSTSPYEGGTTPNIVLDTATVNGYADPSKTSLVLKNGTSLNSLVTYIPPGTSPTTPVATLDAGLLADAGQQNFNFGPGVLHNLDQRILNPPQNDSYSISLDHDFGKSVTFFASYAVNSFTEPTQYDPYANSASEMEVTVPGNAPANPFEQNVIMTLPMAPEYASAPYNDYQSTRNANFGLSIRLPADWTLETDYTWSEDTYRVYETIADFNSTTGEGAYAPLIYDGAFNPFVDTEAYPLPWSSFKGPYIVYDMSGLADFNLRASGPLFFNLPGGRPKLTIAGESRLDTIYPYSRVFDFPPVLGETDNPTDGFESTGGSRQGTTAIYSEIEAPVVSEKNQIPLLNSLDIQLAGRVEAYNDILNNNLYEDDPYASPPSNTVTGQGLHTAKYSSANQTLGFKYEPVKSLAFRASYATAFIPPTPVQLEGNQAAAPVTSPSFFDPETGQTYTTQEVSEGGNSNLQPQKTKVTNAGAIWTPDGGPLKGLRADLEFFKIFEYDVIQTPSLQKTVDDPSLQSYVIRDPSTGLISEVILADQNLAQEYVDGWNATLDYRVPTSFGTFNFHAGATLIEHLKEPPAAGDPMVEYVGFADDGGVIKTKANATLTWLIGRHWTVGWNTTYYDGYKVAGSPGDPEYDGATQETLITTDTAPQGGYTIPSQIYHNAFASYRFDKTSQGLRQCLDGVTIQVGVDDVFNTPPPFDAYSSIAPFYYSPYGSVLLRSYVVKIRKEF